MLTGGERLGPVSAGSHRLVLIHVNSTRNPRTARLMDKGRMEVWKTDRRKKELGESGGHNASGSRGDFEIAGKQNILYRAANTNSPHPADGSALIYAEKPNAHLLNSFGLLFYT